MYGAKGPALMDHAVVLAAVAQDGEAFRLAPEPCPALV